jgi:hypothetical protein
MKKHLFPLAVSAMIVCAAILALQAADVTTDVKAPATTTWSGKVVNLSALLVHAGGVATMTGTAKTTGTGPDMAGLWKLDEDSAVGLWVMEGTPTDAVKDAIKDAVKDKDAALKDATVKDKEAVMPMAGGKAFLMVCDASDTASKAALRQARDMGGKMVKVTGKMVTAMGTSAIVISKVEAGTEPVVKPTGTGTVTGTGTGAVVPK